MTHDGLAGLDLQYNLLNLTKRISSGGTTLADYHYLADGTRAAAERGDGTGVQYRGSLIYTKEADGGLELDCALTSGGRIANDAGTLQVQHFIRDHLGSVRTVVDGSTGDVLETSDYLPFGKRWELTGGQAAQTVTDPTNRWRSSGKETQSFYNPAIPYNDFGARLHDPRTGRWLGVDPMAEKYSWQSAYSYCSGSPVMYVDSDGKVAHNGYNYGNFLWGAGAKRLGVPRKIAKIGADVNNFLHDVESRFHLDSKDDQKSISMGINWAKEHKNK